MNTHGLQITPDGIIACECGTHMFVGRTTNYSLAAFAASHDVKGA